MVSLNTKIINVDDVTVTVLSESQVIRLWFGTVHR